MCWENMDTCVYKFNDCALICDVSTCMFGYLLTSYPFLLSSRLRNLLPLRCLDVDGATRKPRDQSISEVDLPKPDDCAGRRAGSISFLLVFLSNTILPDLTPTSR